MEILNRMVKLNPIDTTFSALADPTRRQIVQRLLQGEASVSELAEPHAMSLPAILKHVAKLEEAGLVQRTKVGRTVTCSLRIEPLDEASTWLNTHLAFWNERLDALDLYLKRRKETPG